MANRKVSELAPITAPELQPGNLLFLSDISAFESKKLQLGDLGSYLLVGGNLTASIYGTASYANNAATASYALINFVASSSYSTFSTYAAFSGTSSLALMALSASMAFSSSYAITASYALTSSVELVYSSAFADYAKTASYILFTPGSTNGTASYALSSSYLIGGIASSSYAATASWGLNAISSSFARIAIQAITASYADTASFLTFNGVPNGTASYALSGREYCH